MLEIYTTKDRYLAHSLLFLEYPYSYNKENETFTFAIVDNFVDDYFKLLEMKKIRQKSEILN